MRRLVSLLAGSALLLMPLLPVHADEDEPTFRDHRRRVHVLPAWSTVRAARAPTMAVPSDAWNRREANDGDPMGDAFRLAALGQGQQAWEDLFSEPLYEGGAYPPDSVAEILHHLHMRALESDEFASLEVVTRANATPHVELVAPPALHGHMAGDLAWIAKGMAPSVDVRIQVHVEQPEPAVLALGAATLHTGRWVPLVRQVEATTHVVEFNVEIAQESTAVDPVTLALPEGIEIYARLVPGESRHLVQLWMARLVHRSHRDLDLSHIRGVPEGNAMATCRWPRTSVERMHTVLVLPEGTAGTRTARLDVGEERLRVDLTVGAVAQSTSVRTLPPVEEGAPSLDTAFVQAGAVAGRLDLGVRESDAEEYVERFHMDALRTGGNEDHCQLHFLHVGGSMMATGDAVFVEGARKAVVAAEQALQGRRLFVRALTLDAGSLAQALEKGWGTPGTVFSEEAETQLRNVGASTLAAGAWPVVLGLRSGMRLGRSVPGLLDFDVEVAQQASIADPVVSARFDGLVGTLRLYAEGRSVRVRADTAWMWADDAGGTIEMAFRPPVSMDIQHEAWRKEPSDLRRVSLPALAWGEMNLVADRAVPAGPRPTVIATGVRPDGQAILLLVGHTADGE